MYVLNKMKNDYLRVPLILRDLREPAQQEKALSSLTALYIIISSQEEMEFLFESNGIHLIMSFLKSYTNLSNICLKILIKISKRHEKVRRMLLSNNILHILARKLKHETDFSKNNLILYSALIVVLVTGDYEAQNLMRISGCLSSLIHILDRILDEVECKPMPCKNAELIIYAIIASSKDPTLPENRAEIGGITPKVLKYLGKQTLSSEVHQLQVVKCLWLLLKYALDQNEQNQHIFLNSSGLSVLFRSIQDVVDEGKCDEMGDLLAKITGVLIKLKSHSYFLSEASNYCPLMILCSLLNTPNILVVQQSIIFLDSLTREIPRALHIIKDKQILRGIKKAKVMFSRSQVAAEFCQNLLDRMEIADATPLSQDDSPLPEQCGFTSNKENLASCDFRSQLLRSYFCVVHDDDPPSTIQNDPDSWFDSLEISEGVQNRGKNNNLGIPSSTANVRIHKKPLKEKEKNLKKIIQRSFFHLPVQRNTEFNIRRLLSGKINRIFQKFCSFFIGLSGTDLRLLQ